MSCLKVLTQQEEQRFTELYTIENYNKWLKDNNRKNNNYSTLKSFKASCFVDVINNAVNVIKDDYLNKEED